ncbi:MAG: TetR family transcriptional regulator [Maritimibacter sp.]|nr:TetR family transcriptional regulator [Maritimibacter sp.]
MARTPGQTRSNGARTKAKILNAAEHLFGAQGFDAVSLREITDEAGVTLALASYHFGTKESLFEEVVARRAALLCREREARLAALGAGVADTRALLDAFMTPLFEKAASAEPGWTDYFRVVARLGESERWIALLQRHFDKTARAFLAHLEAALPEADPGAVARGFSMVLEIMLATVSQHKRVASLTDGAVRTEDLETAYGVLLDFVTAGMESTQAR